MFDILEGWRPDVPAAFKAEWPKLACLICDCWEHDFTLRPSFVEVRDTLLAVKHELDDGASSGVGAEQRRTRAATLMIEPLSAPKSETDEGSAGAALTLT